MKWQVSPPSWPTSFILLACAFGVLPSRAQTNRLFQWQFTNNQLSASLPSCGNLPIIVKSFNADNSTHGNPPYYMIALAVNGTPTRSLIGTQEDNLSWTVDQPVGTELMLSVVDADGSAGGIPPKFNKVIAGQTTQCLPPPSSEAPFTVTSNLTDAETCQPWGLTIKGGVPPYNLTLGALNSPVVTNVSIPFGDDAFTYINRADPNGELLAAVSDLTGRWAAGTPLIQTHGSSNIDCIGLVSSSGNSTQIKQQAEAAAAAAEASNRKRTSIIIGVCVGVGVSLLLAGIFLFVCLRRRRPHPEVDLDPDTRPRQFEETGGQVLSINSFLPASPGRSTKSPISDFSLSSNHYASAAPFDPYGHDSSATTDSARQSGSDAGRPSFANFPSVSVRRPKAAEAGFSHDSRHKHNLHHPSSSSLNTSGPSRTIERSASALPISSDPLSPVDLPSRSMSLQGTSTDVPLRDGEVIYQHRDAGGVVRELPPPYADRSLANPARP